MSIADRFKRPNTPAAPAAAAPARPPAAPPGRASRYADGRETRRDPMLEIGQEYLLRVGPAFAGAAYALESGYNPGTGRESVKAHLEVVESSGGSLRPGDRAVVIFFVTPAGASATKAFVRAAAGFEDEREYDDFDGRTGAFIEAQLGAANQFAEASIVGRLVACRVQKGKPIKNDDGQPTGEFYQNYVWAPVPDTEQTQGE